MDNQTIVYLTSDTADKFVCFQKYFIPFNIFLEAGVFEPRMENLLIAKKQGGVIKSIVRTDLIYSDNPNFLFIS